ncbi:MULTISPECIES: CBS domain-containing protein [Mycetohabitans]|nr:MULTISPECIES: CBS domain-containing protein [Mycetohabitans]MCF7697451.1 CBS domain-containing protein [Mycetohabitans sp. B2]MCG1048279.1 CBS domain-containing protein [Mycetohabitans sp. B6]
MHRVQEIMSRDVVHISPSDTIRHAAELMDQYDIGVLPVCESRKLTGMVTDRDLAVRALAAGKELDSPVSEVCTPQVEWCMEDDDLDAVQKRMADAQLRRMPVINRQKELVGVLSLGDVATRSVGASHDEVANTLEGVSQTRHH